MDEIILLVSIILFGMVFYQDHKARLVSLWILISLLIIRFLSALLILKPALLLENFTGNILIILFLFLSISIYYSIKEKRIRNIFNNYIGSGDVFLLLVLCLGFSSLNFLFFILTCSIVVLSITLLQKLTKRGMPLTIPYAAYLSLFYGVFLIVIWFFPNFSPYDDGLLSELLTGFRV